MKSTKKIMLYFLLAAVISLSGILLASRHFISNNEVSATRVESLIKSNLMIGDSINQVSVFLDNNGADHSKSSVSNKTNTKEIRAMFRGKTNLNLVKKDVQVIFYFNSEGNLIKYHVKEVFTGP